MLRKILLVCGLFASVLYVAADLLAALLFPGYHSFTTQAVSELMASGAPTERLVDPFFLLYSALMIAFGIGVWMSGRERRVHLTGGFLFAYAAVGLSGPVLFEMNLRGTGDPARNVLHIAVTAVLVLLIFAAVGSGSSMRGGWFRLYSLATMAIMLLSGVVTWFAARGIDTGEPTPWVGITERIDIGAFLLWVVVLAVLLLRAGAATRVRLTGRRPDMRPSALSAGQVVP